MKKYVVTAVIALFACAILHAAEGGTMLQFNDRRFELAHAYAFNMDTPDFEAMAAQGDMNKLVFKKTLTVALSDHEFDAAALAKLEQPFDAFDAMVAAGAVLLTVSAGHEGTVESLRLVLPQSTTALDLDTGAGSLTLDSRSDGKLGGRLLIKGDPKMHEFDPEHIPLIEADVGFETAPAR